MSAPWLGLGLGDERAMHFGQHEVRPRARARARARVRVRVRARG